MAQALRAATHTVDVEFLVHSMRSYFIRRGNPSEPVRYEVERIRDGHSFCTRRVVARQAGGVILHLESSFQRVEASADCETVTMPQGLPNPEHLADDSWTELFDRRWVPPDVLATNLGAGAGRAAAWMRVKGDVGADEVLHRCLLAYLSDDLPADAVVRAHPLGGEAEPERSDASFVASLDHAIWFHRPLRSDEWHLHDFTCHSFVGGRGLAIGHVFGIDGTHAATIAQEVLLRDTRQRATVPGA